MAQSKRSKLIAERVDSNHVYELKEALTLLKALAEETKLSESIDVSVRLGVDVRKSDQIVRGVFPLPHGIGKQVRVFVFANGSVAEAAKEAGADEVASSIDGIADAIKKGHFDYQVVIATPDMMGQVGKLGPLLGPRGLMPNPKEGTVTPDPSKAVAQAKAGQIRYRTEKAGIVHGKIGNQAFAVEQLMENLCAFIVELKRVKPSVAKGIYLKKVSLSSTMGPGLNVNLATFS